jgi:hypothetical protein
MEINWAVELFQSVRGQRAHRGGSEWDSGSRSLGTLALSRQGSHPDHDRRQVPLLGFTHLPPSIERFRFP